MAASAFILMTAFYCSKTPIPGPGPSALWTCNAVRLRAKRNRCVCIPSPAVPPFAPDLLHCLAGGAEDRATQGCDPSADSAAGANALNPRGLGTESPVPRG